MQKILDQIVEAISTSRDLYYQLVLLVGQSGSGKTDALQNIAEELGEFIVNVNLALSEELLELTAKQRTLRLPGIFHQILEQGQTPIVLDNLEILFDKDLKQDPLRLLQKASRSRTVVASWNGSYYDGKLRYADLGHPEYRIYDSVDALIIKMEEV